MVDAGNSVRITKTIMLVYSAINSGSKSNSSGFYLIYVLLQLLSIVFICLNVFFMNEQQNEARKTNQLIKLTSVFSFLGIDVWIEIHYVEI